MKSIKQKCLHFKSDFLQKYDNFDKTAKRGTGLSDVRARFSKYISKYVTKPHIESPYISSKKR